MTDTQMAVATIHLVWLRRMRNVTNHPPVAGVLTANYSLDDKRDYAALHRHAIAQAHRQD